MDGNCEYPAVECPIMGRIIENEVCFDICLVAVKSVNTLGVD